MVGHETSTEWSLRSLALVDNVVSSTRLIHGHQMSGEAEYVKAVTDFVASDVDEVSCFVDDILVMIRKESRRTLTVENLTIGSRGNLPNYCVKPIQLPVVTGNNVLSFALSDYHGTQSGDLSFKKGDIIVGERSVDENWWFGWRGTISGIFPVQWVRFFPGSIVNQQKSEESSGSLEIAQNWQLDDSGSAPSGPVVTPHGWSLYPFQSGIPGELNFDAGVLVHLTKVVDANWLEGHLENGPVGIFPREFVQIVVDLVECELTSSNHVHYSSEDFPPDTYAIVLSGNTLTLPEALKVNAGDTVTILKKCGHDLIEAMDDYGGVGFIKMDCLEIIGSEPDEVRSSSALGHFVRGSLESLRSSGTSIGSNFSGDSSDKRLSWSDRFSDRESPEPGMSNGRNSAKVRRMDQSPSRRADEITSSKRELVIQEIIATEKEYVFGLRILITELEKPDCPDGFDAAAVMTNLKDVLGSADTLIRDLKTADGQVGECFIRNIPKLKEVYTPYCQNSDSAITLLSKYKDNIELAEYMNKKVAAIRLTTNCFDLASMLIKPLQRILKYPLLLGELLKATESSHSDYIFVRDALKRMTEMASSINELKRRKELVAKYRDHGTSSFSERLSRLSFHSMVKKSNRLGLLLSTSIGFTTLIQDPAFQAEERKFQVNKRTIKWFLRNVSGFVEQLKELIPVSKAVSDGFSTLLKDTPNSTIAPTFAKSQGDISSHILNDLAPKIEAHVVTPLENTLKQFQGPSNLMSKRHAKLIDYENAKRKLDKMKDAQRTQSAQEEVELMKRVYLALNAQLLEDLPKFNAITCQILQSRIVAFQHFRKLFSYFCANQILPCASTAAISSANKKDAAKQLTTRVALVLADLKKLNYDVTNPEVIASSEIGSERKRFSSQTFNRRKTTHSESSSTTPRSMSTIFAGSRFEEAKSTDQKSNGLQRSNTISIPSVGKFLVKENYAAKTAFDLTVKKDETVNVIKTHDPMGDNQRWFIESDNGMRGFVPKSCLQPCPPKHRQSSVAPPRSVNASPTSSASSESCMVVAFDFQPTGPHQLGLNMGDIVTVITKHDLDMNPEWYYVENRYGARGYAPAAYFKEFADVGK